MQKLLIFLLLVVTGNISAQDYNLNNFKYRFQKYRAAWFNFNFQGNNDYSIYKSEIKTGTPNNPKSNYDQNRFSMNTNLPISYFKVINTERLQHMEMGGMTINYDHSNAIRNNKSEFSSSLNYSVNNRFYKELNFTEFNFAISGNQYNGNSYNEGYNYYSRTGSQQLNGGYQVNIGKGRGRLEYVTDAVSAMFLLRDLKKKAGIGNYTNTQIENIAKGITKIRNTRFIDYRFRLIDQLTLLDSTLKNNGIKPESDIRYFTTINDNWLYATIFQRYSGKRWSVNFTNSGMTSANNYKYKNSDTIEFNKRNTLMNNIYNGLSLNYSFSKQKNLFVQRNFSAGLGGGLNLNSNSISDNKINNNAISKSKPDNTQYFINVSWGYLFQPNTRTYITFDLNMNSQFTQTLYGLRVSNPNERKQYVFTNSLIPKLSVFKFFSPRFYYSLNVNSNINLFHNQYAETYFKSINTSYIFPIAVNMGFTYTFF